MMNRISTDRLSWALMIASWLGWWGGAWHYHRGWDAARAWHLSFAGHHPHSYGGHLQPDDAQYCAVCASGAHRNAISPFTAIPVPPLAPVGCASQRVPTLLLSGPCVSPDQRGPPAA